MKVLSLPGASVWPDFYLDNSLLGTGLGCQRLQLVSSGLPLLDNLLIVVPSCLGRLEGLLQGVVVEAVAVADVADLLAGEEGGGGGGGGGEAAVLLQLLGLAAAQAGGLPGLPGGPGRGAAGAGPDNVQVPLGLGQAGGLGAVTEGVLNVPIVVHQGVDVVQRGSECEAGLAVLVGRIHRLLLARVELLPTQGVYEHRVFF